MWKSWAKSLRLVGTVLSGAWASANLWGMISPHLLDLGEALINDPHFRRVLHAAGFSLGVGTLIALNWNWIYSKSERGRRVQIADEAMGLRRILVSYARWQERSALHGNILMLDRPSKAEVMSSIVGMSQFLDSHGISHPELLDQDGWTWFVSVLEPAARNSRKIEAVRQICETRQ